MYRTGRTLLISSSLDSEMVTLLLAHLEERGFAGTVDTTSHERSGMVISMPRDTFTDQALDNLIRLAESKSKTGQIENIIIPMPSLEKALRALEVYSIN